MKTGGHTGADLPSAEAVEQALAQARVRHGENRGALLQLLIDLQSHFNHVPATAVDQLAMALGIPRTEILGLIDFYAFLHREPRGAYDILFSDNIIDRMQGSRARAAQLSQLIGCPVGGSNDLASIDFTSCTGLCDQGPGLLVNGRALASMDRARIERMAQYIDWAVPVTSWPEGWFRIEDNIRRRDIVLDSELARGESLAAALAIGADAYLARLRDSGLRGRGGAGFSTARKWSLCRACPGPRTVVCNADEGEPGTFKDRVLLGTQAHAMIEGMTVCAAVIGASEGFIYLRGEYRFLLPHLERVLAERREAGLLGGSILGKAGFDFDIRIHLGAGAYVCGEESALIESLEGKRGIPRIRPPFPVERGYLGRPTVVNNVETFLKAALIAHCGSAWFRAQGTGDSGGTKLLSVSGDCAAPGIYEFPFGTRVDAVLEACGARDANLVQVGGPAGTTLTRREFKRAIAFEDVSTGGSFMVFDSSRPVLDTVANFTDFFVHESCGFCTPCRVGGTLLKQRLDKVMAGRGSAADLDKMREIGAVMRASSQCGLGHTAANPVLDTLEKFPAAYAERLGSSTYTPAFNLDDALVQARLLSGRDDAGAHLDDGVDRAGGP
jgi:[NiFe] hydrogenase diaphorase moiety large subunit